MRRTILGALVLIALTSTLVSATSPSARAADDARARPGALYAGHSLDRAVPGADTLLQMGSRRRIAFFTATLPCVDESSRQILLRGRISRSGQVTGTAGTTSLSGRVVGGRKISGTVSDTACGASVEFTVRRQRAVGPRAGTFHGKSTAVDAGGHPYGANLSLNSLNPRHIAALSTSLSCTVGSDEILQATGQHIRASGAFAFRHGSDIVAGRVRSRRHVEVTASDPGADCRSTVAVLDLRRQR